MKKELEKGVAYNAVMNGQIWSFKFIDTDPDEDQIVWITWSNVDGQEEGYELNDLISRMDEYDTLQQAGVIYPRGDREEDLTNALTDLLKKPAYLFGGMEVPRALVLTNHFAPEGYNYNRSTETYMSFNFDRQKNMLRISTPDSTAVIPNWIEKGFNVKGVMRGKVKVKEQEEIFFIVELQKG
jgi:hypothetical protein